MDDLISLNHSETEGLGKIYLDLLKKSADGRVRNLAPLFENLLKNLEESYRETLAKAPFDKTSSAHNEYARGATQTIHALLVKGIIQFNQSHLF